MTLIATAVRRLLHALCAGYLAALASPVPASAQNAADPRVKEVQVEGKSFLVGDPTPEWIEPVAIPDTVETYPVVLRLIDTQYRIDGTRSVYVRRATMINDAASLTKAGQVLIAFVPQYHLVKLHTVRVLRGTEVLDRTTSASIRFFQRETGLEQGIYSGEVTAAILVNDLRAGDTLEVAYTREGQNPVFGDKFIDFAGWDHGYPSLHRRVAVTLPAHRPIAWKVLGGRQSEPLAPVESGDAAMRRLVFEERSVSNVQPEPLIPPEHNPYRYLQLSEFLAWEDVVAWAEGLFQSQEEPADGELREIVGKLRGKATDEERVAAALEFVQAEIRYFSVSLGESSHRPSPPSVVLRRRYGDCKDKSLLLIALLRALGIESRPVLLALNNQRGLDTALPSPSLFNHVIVQVRLGGQLHYLDPSRLGQHGSLQHMGQVHAHAQVLPIAPGTRGLVTIPEPEGREPRSEVIETATLPSFAGDGELRVLQTWRGVGAENVRVMHQHVPREQMWRSFDAAMEQRYPGAKPVGEPSLIDDREKNMLSVSMTYAIPKMATELDGNWFVRYLPTNLRGALAPAQSATRTSPVMLPSFPYSAAYTFEIKLPDTVSVVTDPRATTIRNKHFSYTQSARFRGNLSKTTIELRVAASQVAPKELQKYADDVRSMEAAKPGLIVIPKAAIRSAKATKKDFSALLRERVQGTVTQTTQAIKSGKLSGADLSSAYCLRSGAHSDLGAIPEALADANEAFKLTPQSPETLHCRGYAHFAAGDFDKSITDYSKGVILGANDMSIHQRGIARFYAGQLEAAAEDFVKAGEIADKEAQPYRDLWLAWTLLRLGKTLPDDLMQRAAAQPRGPWPRPALAVFSGNLEAGEVVKLIERKTDDEGKMAASEGYFYLGQYFLARGETTRARELFERTRQMNVLIYIEHKAAEFELRKLPAPAPVEGTAPAARKRAKPSVESKATRPASSEADWQSGVFAR
jgi:lipoprotein NlpI/transglutaminase-like putative cysteine protease